MVLLSDFSICQNVDVYLYLGSINYMLSFAVMIACKMLFPRNQPNPEKCPLYLVQQFDCTHVFKCGSFLKMIFLRYNREMLILIQINIRKCARCVLSLFYLCHSWEKKRTIALVRTRYSVKKGKQRQTHHHNFHSIQMCPSTRYVYA